MARTLRCDVGDSYISIPVDVLEESPSTLFLHFGVEKHRFKNSGSWVLMVDNKREGGESITEGPGYAYGYVRSAFNVSIQKSHTARTVQCSLTLTITGGSNPGTQTATTTFNMAQRTSYTVSYNANGGDQNTVPSSQTKWDAEILTLSSGKPTRTGYAFERWHTKQNAYGSPGDTYYPGGTYTKNDAVTMYAVWGAIVTYSANGGSNAPSAQTKRYGTTMLLSTRQPARAGYRFLSWLKSGTSTTYRPGAAYSSDTPATLVAQWLKLAVPPTIGSMVVKRCDSNGTSRDDGQCCKVTVGWSVDRSGGGMSKNSSTVSGTIVGGGKTRAISWSGATSKAASGTYTAIIENCSVDTEYTVTVTVQNTLAGTDQTGLLSTQRTEILTRGYFTMDFASGGNGVGIGSAAPKTGLGVGLKSQFDKAISTLDAITSHGLTVFVKGTEAISPRWAGFWYSDQGAKDIYGQYRPRYLYDTLARKLSVSKGSLLGNVEFEQVPSSASTTTARSSSGAGALNVVKRSLCVGAIDLAGRILLSDKETYATLVRLWAREALAVVAPAVYVSRSAGRSEVGTETFCGTVKLSNVLFKSGGKQKTGSVTFTFVHGMLTKVSGTSGLVTATRTRSQVGKSGTYKGLEYSKKVDI